ncbi:MAG: phosphotransferase [Terracidiphilus sp.]|nr:phosphotransferase [Terracidiphilus sp.]MDR3777277.1 phosphotransferase [Terracidiphilus sp.]
MSATTTAKVHGMDGTWVEPDWPPLTLPEVRALLRQFPDCGEPIRILTVSPRPLSAASVVTTNSGPVFIKRHHRAVRDREGLLEEHRFLRHLLDHGTPVPRVFASTCGETAIETGEWTYEVHQVPAGVDLYEEAISWTPFLTAAHARSAGAALARLHLAAEGFDAPRRKPQPLVASFTIFAAEDPATELERYLAARLVLSNSSAIHDDCERGLALLAPFHAQLLPLLPALRPLWTHNDLHASNLLWSDAGPDAQSTAIIDFGLADRTNAVHDLAQAIERNIVGWLDLLQDPAHPENTPVHLDHLRALLTGYESVRPLSAQEAAALEPMTALCHAEFALTEADYFRGVLHSEEKTRLATDDYLVGHARWFRSAGGAKLLSALRQWAEARKRQPKRNENG